MRIGLGALICVAALAVSADRSLAGGWACCLPSSLCINTDQASCVRAGGVWHENVECGDPSVDCGEAECRVTGGGVDTFGNWDGTFCEAKKGRGNQVDRYTFGGQVGSPTAAQPQPYGEWTHHQQSGPNGSFVFHAGTASAPEASKIEHVDCSDPGICRPAAPGPCKQIDFDGVGIFHNINGAPGIIANNVVVHTSLHHFEVHIEDLGEPGRNGRQHNPGPNCPAGGSPGAVANCDCPDFYHITIHQNSDPNSLVIYEVYGYIDGGNLQMHPAH